MSIWVLSIVTGVVSFAVGWKLGVRDGRAKMRRERERERRESHDR